LKNYGYLTIYGRFP